jgi:hypothetical protein
VRVPIATFYVRDEVIGRIVSWREMDNCKLWSPKTRAAYLDFIKERYYGGVSDGVNWYPWHCVVKVVFTMERDNE